MFCRAVCYAICSYAVPSCVPVSQRLSELACFIHLVIDTCWFTSVNATSSPLVCQCMRTCLFKSVNDFELVSCILSSNLKVVLICKKCRLSSRVRRGRVASRAVGHSTSVEIFRQRRAWPVLKKHRFLVMTARGISWGELSRLLFLGQGEGSRAPNPQLSDRWLRACCGS